ncbi:MAG TPA: hypothetical protein VK525_11495 [Candidatus Saccharimonadales bacterium]|jgi:uncharacterized membrane protein|nr:hypothetical protein [Candidatus Saccharimonadales bacterium]
MASAASITYVPSNKIRTLGLCWVVYGVLRLIAALAMVYFSGTATVMFGALLVRVPDPFAIMNLFHVFYTAAVVLSVFCSILSIFAGLALLGARPVARMLAICCAVLCLCEIPLGLTLGTYTLVLLLPFSPALQSKSD